MTPICKRNITDDEEEFEEENKKIILRNIDTI